MTEGGVEVRKKERWGKKIENEERENKKKWRWTKRKRREEEGDTSWLMISKHRKCLWAPWRPSINTTLCCSSEALTQTYQPHVNTQKYTDTIRGNLHTHTHGHIYAKCKSSTSINTHKKWFVLRNISSMGEGQGCRFCNKYNISYIIRYASTFIIPNSKQTALSLTQHVGALSQRWPDMCRFCTWNRDNELTSKRCSWNPERTHAAHCRSHRGVDLNVRFVGRGTGETLRSAGCQRRI